jgi:hypothetical protein
MDKKYSVSNKGITFALSHEVFLAGSTVEGDIELDLDKLGMLPQNLKYGVYGLTFRKIGEEKGQTKQDCEYIFKEEKSEKLVLKKETGKHTVLVKFTIPETCPPTFKGWGKMEGKAGIIYYAFAEVEGKRHNGESLEQRNVVIALILKNFSKVYIPKDMITKDTTPKFEIDKKEYGLVFNASLNRNIFSIGDILPIRLYIENNTGKKTHSVKCSLYCFLETHVRDKQYYNYSSSEKKCLFKVTIPNTEVVHGGKLDKIAEVMLSTELMDDNCFTVSTVNLNQTFFLRLRLKIPGTKKKAEGPLNIVIVPKEPPKNTTAK